MKSNFNDKQIQILEVAEILFAEKGFDGTSIRNIAKLAKINIAMVSYYFGSKERAFRNGALTCARKPADILCPFDVA